MTKFLTDRVKKTPSTEVSEERYDFIKLSEVEPDLGVPAANGYVLGSDVDGTRYWLDGATIFGQQGIQGIQGITGEQGLQGIQGLQGTKGDPFKIIGTIPDVNVDPPNDAQATLTAAFPTPSLADGVIDEATTDLWVWNGIAWVNTGSIVGPQGLQGIQGVQGTTGQQGIQGITGEQGVQGIQGTIGDQGIQGTGGLGTQGIQGITGEQGVQGTTGQQGIQGSQGAQGTTGEQGIQGISGTGNQGPQGVQGTTGQQGIQGSQGVQGVQGAGIQGTQGTTGDQGIQGISGSGNQGTTGDQGIQGITGEQGVQGIDGTLGSQGTQGTTGDQGIQGITGEQGVQGIQGAQGAGEQGIQGIQGDQGEQGVQGISGSGNQGTQGTTGQQGVQGIQGSTAGDAATLDGLDSLQFLRSDTNTSMSAGYLTLANDPINPFHAATKEYVDTIASASIHYHDPVRVETPTALNATYDNGTAGVGATLTNAGTQAALEIDSTTLNINDRVLVYRQSNAAHNGVYFVSNAGSISTNWELTRTTDTDSYGASAPTALGTGDAFYVLEGSDGAGELYVMTTEGTITFGTTNITFSQISSSQIYSAGNGLVLNGVEFSINPSADITVSGVTINGVGQVIDSNGDWVGDTAGLQGIQGTAGDQGVQGIQGITGDTGTITETSNTAPMSPVDGQMWFDTTDSTLNVYYDDGSTQQWVTTSGPAGSSGSQGIQGIQGQQGIQGIQGPESASASATELQATNDTATNASFYPVFVANVGAVQTVNAADTKLYFNPSTGTLNATNFNSLSDVAYKENIEKIPNSIEMLNAIQTYSFNWKDNKNKSYGVIAQELEKVMPELVEKNANGDKTVSYMPLIAIVIEAIKKLDDKIEGKI